MKLMVGRGLAGRSAPVIGLSTAGQFLFHGSVPECTF